MSTRGTPGRPTSLYEPTGFAGATPGATPGAAVATPKSLSPISRPYVTDLPPPETTPLLTLRSATGTPRLADASASSTCLAVAAALRSLGPASAIELLPNVPPVFGV
jgi:hypothetical protein